MNFDVKRKEMVEAQLKLRGIADKRVLEAFLNVERHLFVPKEHLALAYEDHPLSIGSGQTISQPYIVALMTEALRLKGNERVLEIGTGSGYQAAILASLCKEVYTVERSEDLLKTARTVLSENGFDNISYKCGDGTLGWEEKAPFDGIIVTAASPDVPEALKNQMREGARLVIPVGERFSQMLILVVKKKNNYVVKYLCPCVFVPLLGEQGWSE